jgi:hypothetical protein
LDKDLNEKRMAIAHLVEVKNLLEMHSLNDEMMKNDIS